MRATLFNPLFWILVLLLVSLIVKNIKAKSKIRTLSLVVFFVFTNNYLISFISHHWDYKTIGLQDISEPYDAGILLGPFIDRSSELPNGNKMVLGENYRLTHAIELYKRGAFKKLILCGNDESIATREYLIRSCIPESDILTEPNSNNTYENAVYAKKLLEELNMSSDRILLMTSAWHMPRAYGCFKKQQIEVTPFSLNYAKSAIGLSGIDLRDLIPNPNALIKWGGLLQEWATVVYFKFKGYT